MAKLIVDYRGSATQNNTVEPNATHLSDIGMIRLKFSGMINDTGPELILDYSLARATVKALQDCLPEEIVNKEKL